MARFGLMSSIGRPTSTGRRFKMGRAFGVNRRMRRLAIDDDDRDLDAGRGC